MYEILPQQPQHPQHFQVFKQQNNFHFGYLVDPFAAYRAHTPSPLGLCNTNSVKKPAPIFSTMKNTCTDNNADNRAADKENNNNQSIGFHSPNQQNASHLLSFTPTSSEKESTYEQRFKSGSSNRPFAKIFGSPSSGSSSSTAHASKQRTVFLNKVKRDRDNARFNARGESIMMMEHISEQKQWQERMRREADMIFQQYHLDEGELSDEDLQMAVDSEQDVLEQILSHEDEMDALLENIPENETTVSPTKSEQSFDDDMDYEDIFKELVGNDQQQSLDMDMSG
ncbi:hypothetical protein BGW36DRAFT_362245 [Talaromyces proteolyticus]|uniref:Uncharacterized protein n=1 Tax=Talaromyces proteolyticus TaxID=1131652 RepID=A0AAD4KMM5_9EURO|nr:uncharacterized protein BGW36DRAFT_362245 [Talaromyces proteolyticus]KAH8692695.1 hypothetical protein BGW36DRAFT_362245 [Talaromyces proteolyticus]